MRSRHRCPACECPRCFARYIDTEGKVEFPGHVGRCDHEQRCGYHFTPKDYFAECPEAKTGLFSDDEVRRSMKISPPPSPPSFIDRVIMKQTLRDYQQNKLYLFLARQLGEAEALKLMQRYYVGSSKHWSGATVFWQIDREGHVRTGKVMLYNAETGKRVKEPFNHITWVHSLLKLPKYNLSQCFFGEHLLSQETSKPIALVESEKTALIASYYLPQYLWLATGGKNGCFRKENLAPLQHRKVILFPDFGATAYWEEKLQMMQSLGIEVRIFDYLERHACPEEQKAGYDIADYLLQIRRADKGLQELMREHPRLKMLVDRLGLKVAKEQRFVQPTANKKRLRH